MKSRQEFVSSANIETLNRCVVVSIINDKNDPITSRKFYNAKEEINRHINYFREQIYNLTDTLPYKVAVKIQDFPVTEEEHIKESANSYSISTITYSPSFLQPSVCLRTLLQFHLIYHMLRHSVQP